jgi:hypothetical protein
LAIKSSQVWAVWLCSNAGKAASSFEEMTVSDWLDLRGLLIFPVTYDDVIEDPLCIDGRAGASALNVIYIVVREKLPSR